jgi:hypothetical protein
MPIPFPPQKPFPHKCSVMPVYILVRSGSSLVVWSELVVSVKITVHDKINAKPIKMTEYLGFCNVSLPWFC